MHCRTLDRLRIVVAALGLVALSLSALAQSQHTPPARGRKHAPLPPAAHIEVTVVRDSSGKPIENASVIFHPVVGVKIEGNMELKTNDEGKTLIDVLVIGDTIQLQVIAKGFQTFGDEYTIATANMEIEIRLKRPGEQYSIYKPHPEASEGGKDSGPRANPPAPAAPAAPDKPAAPDAQPAPPPAK